jgi:hypothetical protein
VTRRSWIRNVIAPRTPRTIRKEPARSRLALEELEDRCLLSGGVQVPSITQPDLSQIMWDGAKTPLNPGGITFASNVTVSAKTVTIQNTTDQTIYPFFRDANTGLGAGANNTNVFYDPQDFHNQEYRLYVGYQAKDPNNNNQLTNYLGVLPHSSITVRVPVVFWNAENTYIATDGTNLIPTQPGQSNPFTYDPTSQRGISPIVAGPNGDGYWVTSFASTDSNATAGFVMLYHATTSSTPALPAPAQLAEFTIRDPFLQKFGFAPSTDATNLAIDYDVSYVDNAIAPITMEASAVPFQIPTTQQGSANPPAPSYGWTGSQLTFAAMQADIQNFINNNNKDSAYLGSYFTNPLAPPPPPGTAPPGWPAYYTPTPTTLKIPGGQNVFLQSPLNGTTSSLDHSRYMLTSGGTQPISISPGGDALTTGHPTQLPLTLDPAQRNALASQLKSMLQAGNLNLALSTNPNTTVGQVTGYDPSGKLRGFAIVNGGQNYTSNLKYKLSGGGVGTSATGTAVVKSGHISLVKLPNSGGGGLYTSAPSLTFTSGGGGGTGAQVYPDIGGGTATVALNGGVTLPTKTGLTYIFSRPVTDYAATDITDLWYTWAQYYINYFKNLGFTGEDVQGTLTLSGDTTHKNQAAFIAVKDSDLSALNTPLAVGMTVKSKNDNSITPAQGTQVTVVSIQPDVTAGFTDFYLSQLQPNGASGLYTFGPPQALPYSDATGIETISVTNGGTGYVAPLTVTLQNGNGAGATAVIKANDITGGKITNIEITNPGGNYAAAPDVVITGGGGAGATAKAVITNGQVTGFTNIVGGSGYTLGATITIAGNGSASATAVVNPDTKAVTGIVVTNPGTGYDAKNSPTVTINGNGNGSGATASATVGTFVSTYANLLPDPTTPAPGGGTVLQFAGSVYEALEAEASIPPAQSLRFYNAVMPPPVGLVGTTIGSDLGDLPNSNGGSSVLGGQVRDLIKSVLRGVWNFEAVPEFTGSTQNWYPDPSKPPSNVTKLSFNPFNLDPYVWFIHDTLGMSGYGFSTDDDIANVNAGTSPYATDPSKTILPNNLVMAFGGIQSLPQPQQWFPGVPWGTVKATGQVTVSGGQAYVTLAPGGNPTQTQVYQYFQVAIVTPGQSGSAFVTSSTDPSLFPAGTQVFQQKQQNTLSFILNVPKGQTVTPSGGIVNLTFSGIQAHTFGSPPPASNPPPALSAPPPSNNQGGGGFANFTPVEEAVTLAQDEMFITIVQFIFSLEQALGFPPDPALVASLAAFQNSILANPLAQTLLGQELLNLVHLAMLDFLTGGAINPG